MQNKVSINTNIGMLRDRSISKVDNQFAFENHNIRITARDKDTLLSVTNERGNAPIILSADDSVIQSLGTNIKGTLLGYAVLNNYLVLFTKDEDADRIYRVEYLKGETEEWKLKILYEGNLKFSIKCPIETISLYETEDVQKVYWVDGKNQPRVINIKRDYFTLDENQNRIYNKETIFDFVTDYNHSKKADLSVIVEKQQLGLGAFPAGVIQYICTYYNKYGQETNPVYISPLSYISPSDRGGDAETTYTCSFKISLDNVDNDFDFVRIYALIRTAESGNPISYIVGTINIKTETPSIVDTGQGDNILIDPTILLYVGGREISAGTFSHKDNTLFLGDIEFKSQGDEKVLKQCVDKTYDKNTYLSNIVEFKLTSDSKLVTPYYDNDGLYPYECQLNSSSNKITGFKGGEKYRFAIQFITPTGQRSKAFFIGDAVNNIYPVIDTQNKIIKRALPFVTLPSNVIGQAKALGYVQVELLMAEASDGDRAIVAQGIINPTVFNLSQRVNNAPFALSSWYMRPRNCQINSRHFESVNNISTIEYNSEDATKIDSANVTFCEIQNIRPGKTPYYTQESFEEQLIKIAYEVAVVTELTSTPHSPARVTVTLVAMFLFQNGGQYHWRQTNSPNSEEVLGYSTGPFDSLDYTRMLNLPPKFKVETTPAYVHSNDFYTALKEAFISNISNDVFLIPTHQEIINLIDPGATPGTPSVRSIGNLVVQDAQSSATTNLYVSQNSEQYFIDENIVTLNTPDIERLQESDISGLKLRIVGVAEVTSNISDYTLQTTTGRSISQSVFKTEFNHTDSKFIEGLVTYPLLYDIAPIDTSGEFISEDETDEDGGVGGTPMYFDIYPFHKEGSIIYNDKLKKEYSKIEKKIFSNLRYCYNTKFVLTGENAWTPDNGVAISATYGEQSSQFRQLKADGTPYIYQGTYDYLSSTGSKEYEIFGFEPDTNTMLSETIVRGTSSKAIITTSEPVRIQFQSLPHVVMKLGKVNGNNEILPKLSNEPETQIPEANLPWNDTTGIYQKSLSYSTTLPYYFIGELYKDFSEGDDRYGGKTLAALENNKFIVISDRYTISDEEFQIIGTQGDTYFQRWDCQKTEPYSNESKNGIVDITSFMVETHTNIEGRYDGRRGFLKNVVTSRENSNLINKAYTNLNNYFSSRILDEKYYLSTFRNQITWSKTKTLSEDIDTWTNINVSNVLDLDGDKGYVRAIRRFNNALVAFQDRGVAEILFNSRTQIATTTGVPIEIGNSGKVEGKRYISEKSGCINKWSIVETKSGIYFIDNINKNISVIGQGIQELSSAKGFDAWVKSYNSVDTWNPKDFNNFVGFYDSTHGDVYFIRRRDNAFNNDNCLVFNEYIGQFTSFFDYIDVPMMVNIRDRFISFKNINSTDLWLQNEGEYNRIYGETYPYWITYRICPDPYGDKTFNNIEYRADIIRRGTADDVIEYPDSLITGKTFDRLKVWNEYQEGESVLKFEPYKISNIKVKFRMWRANIPRDSKDPRGLNRIRNPWAYIQLKKDTALADERMEFHDLMVKYYE